MKPEELKIIAEGIYQDKFIDINNGTCFVVDVHITNESTLGRITEEYNPLTNDTQCMEIMKELLNEGNSCSICKTNGRFAIYKNEHWTYGKTINEVVCKAALEYFN